jgi:hypothetical protein
MLQLPLNRQFGELAAELPVDGTAFKSSRVRLRNAYVNTAIRRRHFVAAAFPVIVYKIDMDAAVGGL